MVVGNKHNEAKAKVTDELTHAPHGPKTLSERDSKREREIAALHSVPSRQFLAKNCACATWTTLSFVSTPLRSVR